MTKKTRRRSPRSVIPLGDILAEYLASLGQSQLLVDARIACRWEEMVGKQVARQSYPLRLRSGVLAVAVISPVWMNQLSFMREEIAAKVNQGLGGSPVESVKLVPGNRPPSAKQRPRIITGLSREEDGVIDEACRVIADPELRAELTELLRRQLCLIKSRSECSPNDDQIAGR